MTSGGSENERMKSVSAWQRKISIEKHGENEEAMTAYRNQRMAKISIEKRVKISMKAAAKASVAKEIRRKMKMAKRKYQDMAKSSKA